MKSIKMPKMILFSKKDIAADTEKSAALLMIRRKSTPERIRNAAVLTSRNIRKNRSAIYATQE